MFVNNRKWCFILLLVSVGLTAYLLWGPLFPWNPFKIGYEKIKSSRASVYISAMTEKDFIVYRIDDIILGEEKFHGLEFTEDFAIIILDEKSDMRRFLLWLKGSRYSVSLSIINVIYIGPTARKTPSLIESNLKHELSHLLIDQNTSFTNAMKIHEQGWLAEGIAEYYSGRYFYSKKEFFTLAQKNNLSFTSLYEKNPLEMSTEEIKLKYSYYRFFIEFLVENSGLEKLQEYLKRYIHDPDTYKDYFAEVYSLDLDEILQKYKVSFDE